MKYSWGVHPGLCACVREREHYGLDVLSSCLLFCFLIKQMGEEHYLHFLKCYFLATLSRFLLLFVLHKIGCWCGDGGGETNRLFLVESAAVAMPECWPMFTHLGNERLLRLCRGFRIWTSMSKHTHTFIQKNKAFWLNSFSSLSLLLSLSP